MLTEADDGDASVAKKQAPLVTLEWKPASAGVGQGQGHYGSAKQGGVDTGQQGQGEAKVKRSWLAAVVACCKAVSRCCQSRPHDTPPPCDGSAQEHLDEADKGGGYLQAILLAPTSLASSEKQGTFLTPSLTSASGDEKSRNNFYEDEESEAEHLVEDVLQREAFERIEEKLRHEVAKKRDEEVDSTATDEASRQTVGLNDDKKDTDKELSSAQEHEEDLELASDDKNIDIAVANIYEDVVVEEHWIEDDNLMDSPPPSYAESQKIIESQPKPLPEFRVDLSRLDSEAEVTASPDSASTSTAVSGPVPRTESDVRQLVNAALDILWEMRRNGDAWQGASAPASYLAAGRDERGLDFDLDLTLPSRSSSRTSYDGRLTSKLNNSLRAYRSLVFDLTGEMLTDLYGDDDNVVEEGSGDVGAPAERPWYSPAMAALRRVSRRPPRLLSDVRPIIAQQVSRLVTTSDESDSSKEMLLSRSRSAIVMRRRPDIVDRVLFEELQEEEHSWVTYDNDELAVKLHVTDAILDLLLADTIDCFNDIQQNRDQSQ